jgi:hypothetical protein
MAVTLWHTPATHAEGQVVPHPPQLFGSVCSLAHTPAQLVNPPLQVLTHCPLPPQVTVAFGSDVAHAVALPHWPLDPHVSMAALPEHCVCPGVQTATLASREPASCVAGTVQTPLTHEYPDGQTFPHVPQLFGSVCSFTQVLLHMVIPDGHVVVVASAPAKRVASSDGSPASTSSAQIP